MKFAILFMNSDGAHVRLLAGSETEADRAVALLREKYDLDPDQIRYLSVSGFMPLLVIEDEYREYRDDLAQIERGSAHT